MGLIQAKFERLKKDLKSVEKSLDVQFNPTEYTLNKGAQIADINMPGLDAPILQFVRGQTETLTMDLFFDSTDDKGMGDGATPVTKKTDLFYQLVKIDPELHAPPVCRFSWGESGFPGSQLTERWATQKRTGFKCIVESVRQRFTLFNPQGVPLRATLTVTLREYKTITEQVDQIGYRSPDHTRTRIVQRGDTLSRIAGEVYGDPNNWRPIADSNRLLDPLNLPPGTVLEIPPIR
jgi:hypothetical protein